MSEQRERALIEARRRAEARQKQRRRQTSRTYSESEQSGTFFNALFRQIIISGIILAFLFAIKGIDNPTAKTLNSYIQNGFKQNYEYDWIISNINKSAEYIMSMLASNK